MPMRPYEEFAKEPLQFPIAGKTYTVPPLGAQNGLQLVRWMTGDDTDAPARSLFQVALGTAFDQMVDDNVPLEALARAGYAAIVDWQQDRDAAVKVWEGGIPPEAQAALMAALSGQTTQPSTQPAAAPTTPKRASGTGTRTRTRTTTGSASKS
jgi:hypothetical protein